MRRKILPLPNLTFQSRGDTFKPCSAGYQPSKVCFVCPRGRELQKKLVDARTLGRTGIFFFKKLFLT